ncbi:MAG TPA: acetate--CoA ligase, partial [Arenimonas sp.]|nr:acetate--CoA ligase [Arenimonas sp.]
MTERYPVPAEFAADSKYSTENVENMQKRLAEDTDGFWREQAGRLTWSKPFSVVKNVSFHKEDFRIKWFEDGELNVAVNCLDRHLPQHAEKTAIIWESDNPDTPSQYINYQELHDRVCQLANALENLGVRKGDRVTIYLPMIPEAAISMLACARIGAIHSVVFAGFSPDAIASRLADCQTKLIITASAGQRAGKWIAQKSLIDEALKQKGTSSVETVLVVRHGPTAPPMQMPRDRWFDEVVNAQSTTHQAVPMNAEDPLFILYTSGSTGKPKGVLHTTGGYLLHAAMTHEMIFDLKPNDVYWCTADVGWITGHSYMLYGPLANAATTLMFEGVPSYPDFSRCWQVVDKHQVTIFYTAPTAIRALMREGDAPVQKYSRKSIRLLGTVGEPINPEAWTWYHRVVGDGRCPVVDTWWQTETGGILIAPLPSATSLKPGSATLPFFGVQPALLNAEGELIEGAGEGNLVLTDSWPGQMRSVYGDHQRFFETYFSTYPGNYFTGDGARRDADGYYWITGRVDDVLNISGHRLGTAEIESALVSHPLVAEAAVVGAPHDIKGHGIYVFVTLKNDAQPSDALRAELIMHVREHLSPIASPDWLQWAPGLPKTRSGKIMRRIL